MRVQICTVSDTLRRHFSPAAVPICPAWYVWYRVQTGAARPAFGRVCRSLRGLRCCLRCAVRPGVLGPGSPPLGYMGRAGGGEVDTSRRKNSKKAFFGVPFTNTTPPSQTKTHPIVQVSKFSEKYKKDLSPDLICAILDRKKGAL